MLPRNATRDSARVLGHDYGAGDRLAKLIPEPVMGRSRSFDQYLTEEPDLRRAYDTEPEARQIIDTARGLEGIVRNAGIHAAAVVIADRPLTDIVPVQLMEDRSVASVAGERAYKVVTQYSMKPIEEIGLLKMDFLGLRNLDVIEDCLAIIEESAAERPDMATLPLDDPKTYEMMARGDSIGVFQFESDGMRDALRKVRPTEFEDLVALVALYRPGAMRHIDTYARNKRNPDAASYVDARLRPITEATYSVILYQEQSMQIAKTVAGFSGAEADDLRKAIGKKNRDAMAALRERFFAGARASGTTEPVIAELWAVNEAAADYSFNRSHAACYALISYRTAWLKANYPAEYMAALISSVMSTKDKVPFFVAQCEDMGIEVLAPDVNQSGHDFKVVEGNIRFGLDAVKGLGYQAVEAIIRARAEDGPFTSIWDFCRRVDCQAVNKRCVESLAKCGAFDSLPGTRTGVMSVLAQAQAAGGQAQQDAQLGQGSFFDLEGGGADAVAHHDLPIPPLENDRKQLNEWEKETLGLFLSSHPLKELRHALRAKVESSIADLGAKKDGEWVTVGGMIAECKRIRTKKGDPMMFATLDDLEGQVELLVFNSAYAANADKVDLDKIVIVRGRVDHKEAGETKLVAQEVTPFEPTDEEVSRAGEQAVAVVERLTLARVAGSAGGLPRGAEGGRLPPPRPARAAAGRRRAAAGARRRVQGDRVERLPDRAVGPPRRRARGRLKAARAGRGGCLRFLLYSPHNLRHPSGHDGGASSCAVYVLATRRTPAIGNASKPSDRGRPVIAAVSPALRRARLPPSRRRSDLYTHGVAPIPARTTEELHECRQCCSFCDRTVHPSGCIATGCQYLYLYDDEDTGRRFMGCMNKVFRGEIDVELFEQAERTRHGFGGVKMSGLPLPQCRSTVERAYDGYTEAFDCVNPGFFRKPTVEDADAAFDLRDGL